MGEDDKTSALRTINEAFVVTVMPSVTELIVMISLFTTLIANESLGFKVCGFLIFYTVNINRSNGLILLTPSANFKLMRIVLKVGINGSKMHSTDVKSLSRADKHASCELSVGSVICFGNVMSKVSD